MAVMGAMLHVYSISMEYMPMYVLVHLRYMYLKHNQTGLHTAA